MSEQKKLGRPNREKIEIILGESRYGSEAYERYRLRLSQPDDWQNFQDDINRILALIPDIEEAKKQVAYSLFEEIICPMCYRLNPQHATMDNGEGCHSCQEREDWQALKGEK